MREREREREELNPNWRERWQLVLHVEERGTWFPEIGVCSVLVTDNLGVNGINENKVKQRAILDGWSGVRGTREI